MGIASRSPGRGKRTAAFTLVELLVVIGIVAVLAAILLPAITSASSAARAVQCAANIRQVGQVLSVYAASNRGRFPPNVSAPSPRWWYDADRLGGLIMRPRGEARGRAVTCPEDQDSKRSYAMNVWASSAIDANLRYSGKGRPWSASTAGSSKLILVSERWSSQGGALVGWVAPPVIGYTLDTPGRCFGGGTGLIPLVNATRWGWVNSELAFARHRARNGPGRGTQPLGRVNIGFADGHVALKSHDDLVDPSTGLSRLEAWWTPDDARLNR
jgi:prepilin-type processing-associated H-X9-DG protein/prepilin-type N-terminal cleavage/methylation domain-containing protein